MASFPFLLLLYIHNNGTSGALYPRTPKAEAEGPFQIQDQICLHRRQPGLHSVTLTQREIQRDRQKYTQTQAHTQTDRQRQGHIQKKIDLYVHYKPLNLDSEGFHLIYND